ncbi:formate dehydrogenase accessory sulfurtransferase FdhD [Skermania piniformis]|uniref:Sulfur carrier protein FdhD n=1 Tax=Skermania pinensis TaxID=39122 RepID=A0ABX8S4T8_9ACTN|nr:formate dehydrogenase accessory sulfurtransferase FdhD [Skermania piniformis]QXQ12843.1 formate dehydrogenase accessory sulfurtransferase FdhD [Skermania piniformis]
MGRVTTRRTMHRFTPTGDIRRPDTLAVEEPLELRVDGAPLTVTMRTPGDDIDLAYGFLFAEGILDTADDIATARYCAGADDGRNTYNTLDIRLRAGSRIAPEAALAARNFLTSSACGVCGKASLDQVRTWIRFPIPRDAGTVSTTLLSTLPAQLREQQKVFDSTGGLHAAGLFDTDGNPLVVREDVGRHNAVDKVIGWAVRADRVPLHDAVLIVSGRTSFELVQKAVMAGIPVLGAVSAPSSLAVDLAADAGLTLVGFLRGTTMNGYTGLHRLIHEPAGQR